MAAIANRRAAWQRKHCGLGPEQECCRAWRTNSSTAFLVVRRSIKTAKRHTIACEWGSVQEKNDHPPTVNSLFCAIVCPPGITGRLNIEPTVADAELTG